MARSLGTGMAPATVWLTSIGLDPIDVLLAGDANGDGKEDLVLLRAQAGQGLRGAVHGDEFGTPTVWHNFFAVSTYERPRVADVNGDGRRTS